MVKVIHTSGKRKTANVKQLSQEVLFKKEPVKLELTEFL